MQVAIETIEGLERRLTIDVPAEQVDVKVDARLQEASKTIKVNGFRKGKVPLKVIKQQYGQGVRQEVLGDIINQSFEQAIIKESVKPAGQPNIEIKQFEEGQPLSYTATFEVYPSIALNDLSGYEVTRLAAEVTDADLDEMIETLRDQKATFSAVERASALNDKVIIDFKGTKEGVAFEGGAAEKQDLVLGSNSMIPGFEDGITGMSAGDTKTIEVTFPEDYQSEDLKGQKAEFEITVHSVEEKTLPEVNADFIKQFGVKADDVDSFKSQVRDNMVRELDLAAKSKVKKQVMDKLLESHEVDVPKALVGNEIKTLRQQMIQQFGGAENNKDVDFESILPDDMFKEQADNRVALGLVITEVVQKNEIKPDADKVRALIDDVAAAYPDPQQVVNYYYQNQELLASAESSALEEQVVEFILNQANVTDITTSYKDVVKKEEQ